MQCTPKEIEEKRRLAQEKLAAKFKHLQSPLQAVGNCERASTSPRFKFQKRSSFDRESKPYEKPPIELGKQTTLQFYGKDKVVTGKCVLLSDERFSVDLTGFSTTAIEVFKTIPTRNYDSKSRIWDFHIKDYELLIQKLVPLQPSLLVEKLPKFVLNCVRTPTKEVDIDVSKLDSEIYNALMPFQFAGLSFGVDKNGRCLIADDMGLGKTFQALAIANYYKEDWPLLIATTATMKNIWEETIHKYLPSVSIMETQYMISGKDYIGDAKILIVSHDLMSRCLNKLVNRRFGVVIIDESHVLKNFKTKCTQSATEICKTAKRVVLLSGTPALSRPSELYSQLNILDSKFFGSFFEYSKRYCDGQTTNFGWDASGKSNLQELEIILGKKFMIRRTKEDVLRSLPNKTQEIVTLDVNLAQFSETDRQCLNALAAKYNSERKSRDKHTILLTFFAETARIKIPSVCSYILQVLESKQKFLVFAHHQIILNALENIIKRKDTKYIRIDGHTTSDRRKYFVDKFQLDPNYQCALLSITAANAGITLTAAKLVVFAELHWNPSILSQAESRAHRIGQESSVLVKYLLAPGTADDLIWPLLQEKQKILSEVGLSKDSFNDLTVTKQDSVLTNDLDITVSDSLNVTEANTLDITTYFKIEKVESKDSSAEIEPMDFFNDGLDDVLCNLNF